MFRTRRLAVAVISLVLLALAGISHPVTAQQITLVAGGDVNWDSITKPPDVYLQPATRPKGGWLQVPYLNLPAERAYLKSQGRVLETPESHWVAAIHYGLHFNSKTQWARYPFRNIAPVLRQADIAFVNLETPLSDTGRNAGAFRTPTAFADGLRWAGIDVVSTANNHALDDEGQGLMDTKEALWQAGVGAVGTGRNLADARRPFILERNGIKVGFLAYSQFVNVGTSAFAQPNRSGVAPLDPIIIKQDIQRLRSQVDYVVLSFHWGIENSQDTHADERAFAHEMIDAGADVILGTHPHVPRGIEVYKGKVIAYCLGNFIFGHAHTYWGDNYLLRLTMTPKQITEVEVLPISGKGTFLSHPSLLKGAEAQTLLETVRTLSSKFDTDVKIEGNEGVIQP